MTEEEIDPLLEEPLPEWATGRAQSHLVLGAQLPTKDGRRCGNAHVVGVLPTTILAQPVFRILTDAGTLLGVTEQEIEELFHPPQWVSDIKEVLRKFQRNE